MIDLYRPYGKRCLKFLFPGAHAKAFEFPVSIGSNDPQCVLVLFFPFIFGNIFFYVFLTAFLE